MATVMNRYFGKGNENEAYARYFTGKSHLQPMVAPS